MACEVLGLGRDLIVLRAVRDEGDAGARPLLAHQPLRLLVERLERGARAVDLLHRRVEERLLQREGEVEVVRWGW